MYSGHIAAVLVTAEQIQRRTTELAAEIAADFRTERRGDLIAGSAGGDLVAGSAGGDLVVGSVGGDLVAGSAGGQLRAGSAGGHSGAGCANRDLLLVGVLKGAVMFMTDLARALPIPVQLEFMAVASYGSATSSSGVVRILKDLDRDIAGRDVLIVEDILDSGLTLSWLLKNLAARRPATLEVCTLLRKPDAVKVDVAVRYVGFDIPNEFVVGYGLDYAERYRDLPYIGTLDPKVYAN